MRGTGSLFQALGPEPCTLSSSLHTVPCSLHPVKDHFLKFARISEATVQTLSTCGDIEMTSSAMS